MEMQTDLFKISFSFFVWLLRVNIRCDAGVSCLPVNACGPGPELMVGAHFGCLVHKLHHESVPGGVDYVM